MTRSRRSSASTNKPAPHGIVTRPARWANLDLTKGKFDRPTGVEAPAQKGIVMSNMERIYQIDQILGAHQSVTRKELQEPLGVS